MTTNTKKYKKEKREREIRIMESDFIPNSREIRKTRGLQLQVEVILTSETERGPKNGDK